MGAQRPEGAGSAPGRVLSASSCGADTPRLPSPRHAASPSLPPTSPGAQGGLLCPGPHSCGGLASGGADSQTRPFPPQLLSEQGRGVGTACRLGLAAQVGEGMPARRAGREAETQAWFPPRHFTVGLGGWPWRRLGGRAGSWGLGWCGRGLSAFEKTCGSLCWEVHEPSGGPNTWPQS